MYKHMWNYPNSGHPKHSSSNEHTSIWVPQQGLVRDTAGSRTELGPESKEILKTREGRVSEATGASLEMRPLPKSGTAWASKKNDSNGS